MNVRARLRVAVKSPQDLSAGLFLVAVGLLCLWGALGLKGGTGTELGAGSFPRGISVLLMVTGVLLAGRALVVDGPQLEAWSARGLVFVLGAVLVFAATIRGLSLTVPAFGHVDILPPLGLIVAGPASLIVASFASDKRSWLTSVIFSIAMTAFCIVIFKVMLRLPIPIAPWAGW